MLFVIYCSINCVCMYLCLFFAVIFSTIVLYFRYLSFFVCVCNFYFSPYQFRDLFANAVNLFALIICNRKTMVIRRELQSTDSLCKHTIKVAIDFKLRKHFSNHAWDVLSDISVWNHARIARNRRCCCFCFYSLRWIKKNVNKKMYVIVCISLTLSL